MISRATERNITTLFQQLFTANTISGKDGVEILSRIHKGIEDSSIDNIINFVDKLSNTSSVGESVAYRASRDKAIMEAKIREVTNEMVRELKTNQKTFPANSFSESSLNDYKVLNMNGRILVNEDSKSNNKDTKTKQEKDLDKVRYKNEKDKIRQVKQKEADEHLKQDIAIGTKRLVDTDVKKSNEMQPSLLIINYNTLNSDATGVIEKKTFIAGIKARLISVEAMDIAEHLVAKDRSKLSFLNFIRATTGEISFKDDFLFNIKQAKINAKNAAKHGIAAKMWEVLEKRSTKNAWNKFNKHGNDASAITTLVISRETAEYMKKAFKFDIDNPKNAKLIIDSYNLLSIVIVDEINEVAKFIYDGNNSYEMQAFSYLSKEGSDGKAYQKVINLMNKQGR
jgi:hypothetical protein